MKKFTIKDNKKKKKLSKTLKINYNVGGISLCVAMPEKSKKENKRVVAVVKKSLKDIFVCYTFYHFHSKPF